MLFRSLRFDKYVTAMDTAERQALLEFPIVCKQQNGSVNFCYFSEIYAQLTKHQFFPHEITPWLAAMLCNIDHPVEDEALSAAKEKHSVKSLIEAMQPPEAIQDITAVSSTATPGLFQAGKAAELKARSIKVKVKNLWHMASALEK